MLLASISILYAYDIFTAVKMLNLDFDPVPDIACPREQTRFKFQDCCVNPA
jgi:hypothetical protein